MALIKGSTSAIQRFGNENPLAEDRASTHLTRPALSDDEPSVTHVTEGRQLYPAPAQDVLDPTRTLSSATEPDPVSFGARLHQPAHRPRLTSFSLNASNTLPTPPWEKDAKFLVQNAVSKKPQLTTLPAEIKIAIIKYLIPTRLKPVVALHGSLAICSVKGFERSFAQAVQNTVEIWGASAAKQAAIDSITLREAWEMQFKTLEEETQSAIIATKLEIDIFSQRAINNFSKKIKAAMRELGLAKRATTEPKMKHHLGWAAYFALISGMPEPRLSFGEAKERYMEFMRRSLELAKNAASEPGMKYHLKNVASFARKVSMSELALSPEETNEKYIEFINSVLALASNSASEYMRKHYLELAVSLAQIADLPEPVLAITINNA